MPRLKLPTAVHAAKKGKLIMRPAIFVVALAIVLPQLRIAFADHDMTCHPTTSGAFDISVTKWVDIGSTFPPAELNLIVPGPGGATSTSCSSADGDALPVVLPANSFSAIELFPDAGQAGRYWLVGPTSQTFLATHLGLSAELPNFTTPDGTSLLALYRETELAFVLNLARTFTPGEVFTVSSGAIAGWQGAILLEMPTSFTLDELLAADPSRFPAYSGPAVVADIGTFRIVPEPTSVALLVLAGLRLWNRRTR
jgi:hypothetical protein